MIVIVGAGFSGYSTYYVLKKLLKKHEIEVVDFGISSTSLFSGAIKDIKTKNKKIEEVKSKAKDVLKEIFESLGFPLEQNVDVYTHSGVRRFDFSFPTLKFLGQERVFIMGTDFIKIAKEFDKNPKLIEEIPENVIVPQILGVEKYNLFVPIARERRISEFMGLPHTSGIRLIKSIRKEINPKKIEIKKIEIENKKIKRIIGERKEKDRKDNKNEEIQGDIFIFATGKFGIPIKGRNFRVLREGPTEEILENAFVVGEIISPGIMNAVATALIVAEEISK